MNLGHLIIFAIVIFGILTFLRKWFDGFALIAFAIGALCNTNIYTAISMPVNVGTIVFSLDAVLFTVFLHTIGVKFMHYPTKDAINMAVSSLVAILISAFIELFARLCSQGYSVNLIKTFAFNIILTAIILVLVNVLAVFISKVTKINPYIRLPLGVLIANMLYGTIYYFLNELMFGQITNIGGVLLGTYIARLFCVGLSLICYYVNGHVWVPKDLSKENIG